MKNRHGVEYDFIRLQDDLYEFSMDHAEMRYCRYGGKEGQESVDYNDLGMFDPSGGPYIAVGMKVVGKEVTKIQLIDNKAFLHVK